MLRILPFKLISMSALKVLQNVELIRGVKIILAHTAATVTVLERI